MTSRSATLEDLDRITLSAPCLAPLALLPIIVVIFVAYLVIGIAMPVLSLHVHEDLGFGTFVVGLDGRTPRDQGASPALNEALTQVKQ